MLCVMSASNQRARPAGTPLPRNSPAPSAPAPPPCVRVFPVSPCVCVSHLSSAALSFARLFATAQWRYGARPRRGPSGGAQPSGANSLPTRHSERNTRTMCGQQPKQRTIRCFGCGNFFGKSGVHPCIGKFQLFVICNFLTGYPVIGVQIIRDLRIPLVIRYTKRRISFIPYPNTILRHSIK